MFPASPFIHYYDDECDLKRRANRLKRKIAGTAHFGRSLFILSSVKYFPPGLLLSEILPDCFRALGKAIGI